MEENFRVWPGAQENDHVKDSDDQSCWPIAMIEWRIVRDVGTEQHQSQQHRAVHYQQAAGQNPNGFDDIDVSSRYQYLHERVEWRNWEEFKKAIQSEDHEDKAEKESCDLKNATQ